MAKFIRLIGLDNGSVHNEELRAFLEYETHFVVVGERYSGYEGENVEMALSPCCYDASGLRGKFSGEFEVEFNNLKYGNIGVSQRPPVMGKKFCFERIEPGYGGNVGSRKYFFVDAELSAREIKEVKYLSNKVYFVKTDTDVYYVLVRDVEALPSKYMAHIAVCGDGLPLEYGEKRISYVTWTPDGWYISKPQKVNLTSWNRISERVYKAQSGRSTFYVLVWHR